MESKHVWAFLIGAAAMFFLLRHLERGRGYFGYRLPASSSSSPCGCADPAAADPAESQ